MRKTGLFKKIIMVFFKICLAIFLFVSLNLLFMPKYIESNQDGRLTAEFYREKEPLDIIFTGSSHVNAGISPMYLYKKSGYTSYNRSNSSQTIGLSYYLIEEAIKRNKPQLVVADVGFAYEAYDYAEEPSTRKTLDGMKWSSSKINAIKSSMFEEEKFMDYVFPVLRFHSRWNDLKSEDFKYWFYKPTVTRNGQLIQFNTIDENVEYNPYKLDDSAFICDENIAYIQKIVDICKENNVDVLLIKMPCIQGNWNYSLDNQLNEFAKSNNINYVSFVDDFDNINLDINSDFSDTGHLNSYGAEKFTDFLGDYINSNYSLTPGSNNPKVKELFDYKLDLYESDINNGVNSLLK